MGADTEGPHQAHVTSFTTADLPTLHRIETLKISKDNKLIYVLAETTHSVGRPHHIYILNQPLARDLMSRTPMQRGGLIFVLDTDERLTYKR